MEEEVGTVPQAGYGWSLACTQARACTAGDQALVQPCAPSRGPGAAGALRGAARQLAHAGLVRGRQVERAAVRVALAEQARKGVRVLQRRRLLPRQAWVQALH
jgi:hypothetical protein